MKYFGIIIILLFSLFLSGCLVDIYNIRESPVQNYEITLVGNSFAKSSHYEKKFDFTMQKILEETHKEYFYLISEDYQPYYRKYIFLVHVCDNLEEKMQLETKNK